MAGHGPLGRLRDKVAKTFGGGARRSVPSAPAVGTDGIEVRYAPERDGQADPGEVAWAWVPFEDDPNQGKDRPVLLLGYEAELLVAVQLSSKDHADRQDAAEWIEVGIGAWDSQGRPSYADASRLLRYRPDEIRREGAVLEQTRFDAVVSAVARLHGWQRASR